MMTNDTQESTLTPQWHPDSSRKIIERIIVKGKLNLETPAHFGTGEQNGTELIILEDALTNKPLLPGASIAGALRHYLWERTHGYRNGDDQTDTTIAGRLFGTALDVGHGQQSRVVIDDALGEGHLVIRDGVKIEGDTRTAEDGALFSIQVWERDTSFDLHFELCIYESDNNAKELIQAFASALKALHDGEIRLGARKHRGYGRVIGQDWVVNHYDFRQANALVDWLTGTSVTNIVGDFFAKAEGFTDKRHYFRIDAELYLCDSILIRTESGLVDSTHLTSNGEPVVSGTSIAGALRGRALKIANYISLDAPELINDMFGRHGGDGSEVNDDDISYQASRIIVDEHLIQNPLFDLIQNRVKIDRFTGGAFDTALFEEQPVFAKADTIVSIRIELRFPFDEKERAQVNAQAGLLLLLLKDLWTEDLPIGGESNIGRGRLRGKSATIYWKQNDNPAIEIEFNERGLVTNDEAQGLQELVDGLWGGQA